ncbi:histidine N-alpha-methyltransferase [Sphaerisporangium krabiense]|uniref:L-histidine N-alpha-methyltransferase n=1 Tax=Sphaerisporangium krabiense TaxID=763782 RepID=A0A7W9DN68_9ACTN|nr:L-histidine N(alpha)-methyltransferase [Sphaerisporangium krabiense]MBB5625028.1 L-histidine N-alpha-methyltransferase [Sphaerisporangium krabiense]GII66932.1 histidine N-alpha-methyltransferase [Sphaerisporangium krabiense]
MHVYLQDNDLHEALRRDVALGLTSEPKTLPPKWFYDERGSELFDEITRLDEYYPTRCEREILIERADNIARVTQARTLVELGAGSCEKTRLLLGALRLERYVPVDVSGDYLGEAAATIAAEHPEVAVHPVVADYERHLELLPRGPRKVVAFLGSTIGNMFPSERHRFLADVRKILDSGDFLLLGADLVKDQDRLVRAYDDALGVTAEFNRNVLRVINQRLDADFVPEAFAHVALWDPANEWIEMRLRSLAKQDVRIDRLGITVHFTDGEEVRTEISTKFRRTCLEEGLATAGFTLREFWTDPRSDFSLVLAQPN